MSSQVANPAPPRIAVDGALGAARIAGALPALMPMLRDGYMQSRRWFGDKARTIAGISIADVAVRTVDEDHYALLIAAVDFTEGGPARYFVPLADTTQAPPGTDILAVLAGGGHETFVVDAFTVPRFRAWLLQQIAADATLPAQDGTFRWQRVPALHNYLAAAQSGPSRVGSAEQSNTSVIYADALILKVFRKLHAGINPEVELDRFLTAKTGFRQMPLLVGDAVYEDAAGAPTSLGLAQTFIPSTGDGWSFTLDALAAIAAAAAGANEEATGRITAYSDAARLLGVCTGQMHAALASDTIEPALAPEPITPDDAARWEEATRRAIAQTLAMLEDRAAILPGSISGLVHDLEGRGRTLARRAEGFASLVGVGKARVHGDYHLGQTLRTLADDWAILDFEGEPARPLAERRAKTSPLKDVAGMLRSFGYAHGAALRALPPDNRAPGVTAVLTEWEARTRDAFLAGYRAETLDRGATFVPSNPIAFAAALAAWELDKAVYELAYELNNRPDWVEIPLAALVVLTELG